MDKSQKADGAPSQFIVGANTEKMTNLNCWASFGTATQMTSPFVSLNYLTYLVSFQLNEFSSEFTILNQIQIPCCYCDKDVTPCIELHGFNDASEHAYTAVLYLHTISNDGKVVTRLVASKTRIAPTKK